MSISTGDVQQTLPTSLDSFLAVTDYCDRNNERIVTATRNILRRTPTHAVSDTEITESEALPSEIAAQRLFFWVRDSIKYALGLYSDRASETLDRGRGSCSNKANLLTAMLRAAGIPAGFIIYEVRTREYFGAVGLSRLCQFFAPKSVHVLNCAWLHGRWIHIDPADDVQLSMGASHLAVQATEVRFDGRNHCLLKLAPKDIISISEPVPSIDSHLAKESRHPEVFLEFLNHYLEFLRRQCIFHDSIDSVEIGFFNWMRAEHTRLYDQFVALEQTLLQRTERRSA